ncbi:MAG: sigma-70 family RNA polymerase sigma factor [Gemmatimonadota bacterium]
MSDRFPETRHSIVANLGSDDPAVRSPAFEVLVASYWKPIYKYLRLRWQLPHEQAEDLTQDFFADSLERQLLAAFDPAKARFRTFLRLCLDHLVTDEFHAARRLKRGGGAPVLSLDFTGACDEVTGVAAPGDDPDALFHREWIRAVFEAAVGALEAEYAAMGKSAAWRVFAAYDLDRVRDVAEPSYADVAARVGVPVTQVTNHLAAARRRLRVLVLERVRAVTSGEEEYREELRELFGGKPA